MSRNTTYKTNGITLNVMEDGPVDAPVILFLHGFPEFSYGWRKQIAYFAEKGFHVVAPDQRGYNLSSKPVGIKNYALSELMKDMVGLIEALTSHSLEKKVTLVGHDWGAAVAWSLATFYPQLFSKVVIINVPHPVVMMKEMNFRQLLRSWYMLFFQLPLIPEFFLGRRRFNALASSLQKTSIPATFSDEEIEQYRVAWGQPGTLTAMINWYRALRCKDKKSHAQSQIELPLLILWGKKDQFLGSYLAEASLTKCKDGKIIYFEDATHWVHLEKAAEVNLAILNFIAAR